MARINRFARLDPLTRFEAIEREMEELFRNANWPLAQSFMEGEYPAVNVDNVGDEVRVTAELPGLDASDIELSVTGNTLVISGERKPDKDVQNATFHRKEREFGRFSRSLRLPDGIVGNQAQARYAHGVLEIRFPKAPEAKPHRVEVKPL